jgi:hypothetical protein
MTVQNVSKATEELRARLARMADRAEANGDDLAATHYALCIRRLDENLQTLRFMPDEQSA